MQVGFEFTPGQAVSRPDVVVARTLEELELLRGAWDELPWEREEAAYEYFTTRLATRPDVIGPFAAVATSEGRPWEASRGGSSCGASRPCSATRSSTPRRPGVLRVVDGGLAIGRGDALAVLRGVAGDALASGEADVLSLPPLELGSPELAAFESLGGPLTRQPLIAPWTRRLLDLPDSFEDFLAGLGHRTRKSVRRDARQLDAAFGDRLHVEVVRDPAGVGRLIEGAERVASLDLPAQAGRRPRGYPRAARARRCRPRARLGPRLSALARRDRDRILAVLGVRGHDACSGPAGSTPRSPRTASGSSCSCA